MSFGQFISYINWAVFGLLFVLSVHRAWRQPVSSNLHIAFLCSIPTITIVIGLASQANLIQSGPLTNAISTSLILALGYVLLRLVDDFAATPAWLVRVASVGLALIVAGIFLLPSPRPNWYGIIQLIYFMGCQLYAAAAFTRAARRSRGVTQRRMRAVALGSVSLVLTLIMAALPSSSPRYQAVRQVLLPTFALSTGLLYFLGFITPRLLRRAWQEPELRAFFGRAASLPRLPTTEAILIELERGAATSLGAPHARIGLWDPRAQVLRFQEGEQVTELAPTAPLPGSQVFLTQQAYFTENLARESPTYAHAAEVAGVRAVLAAPITAGENRLGVLVVYAPRAPIFADSDLELVQLLADQAAVILESRALIDEAARVRALEQATRLKDDFLSSAAHDLKTPLTTLLAQTELLERRTLRNPEAPADLKTIRLLMRETKRLSDLVLELLDASRAEQGRLLGPLEPLDLVALAREVCARPRSERHTCMLEAEGPLTGNYDQIRITQLLENLIENAIKYSPEGGEVQIRLWPEGQQAHLTVSDSGIGIPPHDLPQIFERFYRATNVDDRRFAGMGLGLFICRAIVEQHGGTITATSTPGQGTTFHIRLPLADVALVEK